MKPIDYFAGIALQEYLRYDFGIVESDESMTAVARGCYDIAENMIAARQARRDKLSVVPGSDASHYGIE